MARRFKYDGHWRKVRRQILERDGYLCKIEAPGCLGKATEVDHVVPVDDGGLLFEPSNLRACCHPCNMSRQRRRFLAASKPSREW